MRGREAIGLLGLAIGGAASVAFVRDWSLVRFLEPCRAALLFFWLTVLLVLGLRLAGRTGTLLERAWLAAFLGGMPLVYLAELARTGGSRTWWWIELAALPVYGGLAALGLARSAWFLGLGILAHGLAWDLWHVQGQVVPPWYAWGCLVADLALGLYVLTHLEVLRPRSTGG